MQPGEVRIYADQGEDDQVHCELIQEAVPLILGDDPSSLSWDTSSDEVVYLDGDKIGFQKGRDIVSIAANDPASSNRQPQAARSVDRYKQPETYFQSCYEPNGQDCTEHACSHAQPNTSFVATSMQWFKSFMYISLWVESVILVVFYCGYYVHGRLFSPAVVVTNVTPVAPSLCVCSSVQHRGPTVPTLYDTTLLHTIEKNLQEAVRKYDPVFTNTKRSTKWKDACALYQQGGHKNNLIHRIIPVGSLLLAKSYIEDVENEHLINRKNKDGCTPLDAAEACHHPQITKVLQERGAKRGEQCRKGKKKAP